MTEFIITCKSELKPDGSYQIERYRELVRCKDCKHWTKGLGGQCNVFTVNGVAHCTSPDWFCAEGKRKDS